MQQPKKVQKRKLPIPSSATEDQFPHKNNVGSIVYRVASPTAAQTLGSRRFWCLANQNTKSLAKLTPHDPLTENLPPWKQASRQLNEKIEAEKRLQLYNTPYAFLASVGGRTATIKHTMPSGQLHSNKATISRVKSAKIMPRKDMPAVDDEQLIPTDLGSSDFWHKQPQKDCRATDNKERGTSPSQWKEMESKPPSAHSRNWSALRPTTAKANSIKTFLAKETLPLLKEKITQLRVKPSNDLAYHSPVEKIGINMQLVSLLTYEHLSKLKETDLVNKKYLPLQYGISGVSTATPNTIDPNNLPPVTLCLFPEYFDSHSSALLRSRYLSRLLATMRGTYDPQIMARLYRWPAVTERDWRILFAQMKTVSSECISPYNYSWIEQAIQEFDESHIDEVVFRRCIREIWSVYEQSQRMTIASYRLLGESERKRTGLNVLPVLYRSNQEKISKIGGYSRALFESWSNYVDAAKNALESTLLKYNPVNLALQKWSENFSAVALFELDLTSALSRQGSYLDLDTFVEVQNEHFKDREELLRHIWFRGALSVAGLGLWLHASQNPWQGLFSEKQDYRLTYHTQSNSYYKNRPATVIYQELYNNFIKIRVPEDTAISPTNLQSIFSEEPELAERGSLTDCSQLLIGHLYELIESNLTSFERFVGDFVSTKAPVFKLNLSVRSDLLMYNHTQKEVIGMFRELLHRLLQIAFQGADAAVDLAKEEPVEGSSRYLKYLPFVVARQVPARQLLRVCWPNAQIFQARVNRLLTTISECYESCLGAIQLFERFQPLVRRPDLAFDFLSADFDEEAYSYEAFLRHTEELRSYQRSINDLEDGYSYSLFYVNVLPVKNYLNDKISEMMYLAQKKYKRILFRDIHRVEGIANDLAQKLLSGNKTASELSVAESLLEVIRTATLPQLRESCGNTINMILCYIGTMDNSNATDSVLSVLQSKLNYVYKLPQSIHDLIEGIVEKKHQKERDTLETDLRHTVKEVADNLQLLSRTIEGELMNYAYLHSKLTYYNECLNSFEQSMQDLGRELECIGKDNYLLFREESEQIAKLQREFVAIAKVGASLVAFWRNAYRFDQHIRSINKLEVRDLNSEEHERIVLECRTRADEMAVSLAAVTPYRKYLGQFKEELTLYERSTEVLKLLSSKLLSRNHYVWLPQPDWPFMSVRTFVEEWNVVSAAEMSQFHQQIKKICQASLVEHHARTALEASARRLGTLRLQVVRGEGQLDVIDWKDEVLQLDQLQFEVRSAAAVLASHKEEHVGDTSLQKDMRELLAIISEVLSITKKLTSIQQEYLSIEGLFSSKDLRYLTGQRQRFRLIQSIWSDMMKSLSVAGSLSQLTDRKQTLVHLNKAAELLQEVRSNLRSTQDRLCEHHPRLYFVGRELLFEAMCKYDEHLVRRTALSCFPDWAALHFSQGCVVAIGDHYRIVLEPPVEVQSRFSEVEQWMRDLEAAVRKQLLLLFTSLLVEHEEDQQWLDNPAYPEQLKVLVLWLNFTKLVEDQFGKGCRLEEVATQLQTLLTNEQLPRSIKVTVVSQLEIVRELVDGGVSSAQHSLWLDKARFYHLYQQAYLLIGDCRFEYAFNYIDRLDLLLLDQQKIGKCMVSRGCFGKGARIQNLAKLLSIQLVRTHPTEGYDFLEKKLRGSTRTNVWLLVPHILRHPQANVALIYHHLTAARAASKTTSCFDYFLTFADDELAAICSNQTVRELIRQQPVRISQPLISRILRLESDVLALGAVGDLLELFTECLQQKYPQLADMKLVEALSTRLPTLKASQNAEKQLERILYQAFPGTAQQVVQALFGGQPLATTNALLKNCDRSQVVYGDVFFSRKTTKIREQLGSDEVVVLHCGHTDIDSVKAFVRINHPSKRVVLDRGFHLYGLLKPLEVSVVFEEATIHQCEPSALVECNIVHFPTVEEILCLPESTVEYTSIVESIEWQLKLKGSLNRARRQFAVLLQEIISHSADSASCLLYALIWGYGCFIDRLILQQSIREVLGHSKDFRHLPLHEDLESLVFEDGKLSVCRLPRNLSFGCQWNTLNIGSVYCDQILFLSQTLKCGMFVQSQQFLTSHIRSSVQLYIGLSRHTTSRSFFRQFEAVCLERTAQAKHYSPKWQPHTRIVVDDVHLPPSEVVSCLNEMIGEGTFAGWIDQPRLLMQWLIAAKTMAKQSTQMHRLRCRLFNVEVSGEHCRTIFAAMSQAIFSEQHGSLASAVQLIEQKCISNGCGWWKATPNKLFAASCVRNIIDGLPASLRAAVLSVVPQLKIHKHISDKVEDLSKVKVQQFLNKQGQKVIGFNVEASEELVEQIHTLSLHLAARQNVLLVGESCAGKATVARLSSFLLRKRIAFGTECLNEAEETILYIEEGQISSEELEYRLKNGKAPPYCEQSIASDPQWIVSVGSLEGHEELLAWAAPVRFESPTANRLLQVCKSTLPDQLRSSSAVDTMLRQVGLCKDLRMAHLFSRLFSRLWTRNLQRAEELEKSALVCKKRIDSVSPANTTSILSDLDTLSASVDAAERELSQHQQNYKSLTELSETHKRKVAVLEEQKHQLSEQANAQKEYTKQQSSLLEAKLSKHEAKLTQVDTKSLPKSYVELLTKLLKKPLESLAQLRPLSKLELSRNEMVDLKEFLSDKSHSQKAAGVAKILHEWLYTLLELQQLQSENDSKHKSVVSVEFEQCMATLDETTAALDSTEQARSCVLALVQQIKDSLDHKRKQHQELQQRLQRSNDLWRQFERCGFDSKLHEEAEAAADSLGSVMLACLLLLGFDERRSRQSLSAAGFILPQRFSLASYFYNKSKCKRCCKKFGLEEDALDSLVMVAQCPSAVVVVDREGVLEQLQQILDFLKQGEFDVVQCPFEQEQCVKFIRREFEENKCFFDQQRLLIVGNEELVGDPSLKAALKNAQNASLRLVFVVETQAELPSCTQPYIQYVVLRESPKDAEATTERCLLSIKQGVAYSSLNTLKQAILEQEETIESRSAGLLGYLRNPSVDLVEYEDIYATVFGLVDDLITTRSSLQANSQRMVALEQEVQMKHCKVLQLCRTYQQAYTFLEGVESEFQARSWKELLSDCLKLLKRVESPQQLVEQLEEHLTQQLLASTKHQLTHRSRVLLLSYIHMSKKAMLPEQITRVLKVSDAYTLENELSSKQIKLLTDFNSTSIEQKAGLLKDSLTSQNNHRKSPVTAFLLPYPLLESLLDQIQRTTDREFVFFSPHPSSEDCVRVLREACRKGQWLFVFNVHLHPRFMRALRRLLRGHKNDMHKDFRMWLTLLPQTTNILPQDSLALVGDPVKQIMYAEEQKGGCSNKNLTIDENAVVRLQKHQSPSAYVADCVLKYSLRNKISIARLAIRAKIVQQRQRQSFTASRYSQLLFQLPEERTLDNCTGRLLQVDITVAAAIDKPTWAELLRKLAKPN